MSRGRIVVGIVGAIVVIALAFFVYVSNEAPETSDVIIPTSVTEDVAEVACLQDASGNCLRYPIVTGQNLLNDEMTFPDAFEGEYNLVVVPFNRDQQQLADTWLPFAQELAATHLHVRYYNIPIFPDLEDAVRVFARTGLSLMIGDDEVKRVFVTVFLEDRQVFLDTLEIPDVEQIQIFLVTQNGLVLWRGKDVFSEAAGEEVSVLVEDLNN